MKDSRLKVLLGALILLGGVAVPAVQSVLQPPAVIAQAPYFTTQAQLNAKFRQIKIGWTRARVEALLGKPQWGTQKIYNYFVEQNGHSVGEEKALEFGPNGKVVKLGGAAG